MSLRYTSSSPYRHAASTFDTLFRRFPALAFSAYSTRPHLHWQLSTADCLRLQGAEADSRVDEAARLPLHYLTRYLTHALERVVWSATPNLYPLC